MFRKRATTNSTGKRSYTVSTGLADPGSRRQLVHALARLHEPELLAGDLLDVFRIRAQPLHFDGESGRVGSQHDDLALESLRFLLERPHAGEALSAIGGQRDDQHHQDRRPQEPRQAQAHRARPPKAARPGHTAEGPSSSSIRRSWLYLAVRSPRESEPVLICPALTATERSAMNVSSVSPERCEITVPQPARLASSTASSVSVRVPIWFTFRSTALARPRRIPSWRIAGLVTKRSSPTSCTRAPRRCVKARQPSWSSSPSPSSMEQMG